MFARQPRLRRDSSKQGRYSNHYIPINLFLKEEWTIFKPYLRTFNNKSLTIIHGPTCSISELNKRRSKRRSITLVKRIV